MVKTFAQQTQYPYVPWLTQVSMDGVCPGILSAVP